tara:strand:- start:374234 stop:374530 length:297 start_codon:yes stop_codon:yes gene_type:complete
MAPSDKDILFEEVQKLHQKSQSIRQFEKLLLLKNIQTYHRQGKLTGVYYGNRKYRLRQSLGIDIEPLLLRDKTLERIGTLRGSAYQEQEHLDGRNLEL